MLEFANSCLPIIRDGLDAAPLLRLGLDSVRIGELAAVANRFEAARERVASGEREHGIDPIGREAARTLEDIAVPPVDRHVGTKALDEGHAILAGCGGENTCTAQLRELKRHASDTSRGAVNDHGLSRLHMQRIIDALKRGEPGDGDRARMLQIELARYVSDGFGPNSDVLGIEAALRIVPAKSIDLITDLEPADPRPHRH